MALKDVELQFVFVLLIGELTNIIYLLLPSNSLNYLNLLIIYKVYQATHEMITSELIIVRVKASSILLGYYQQNSIKEP